MSRSRQIMLHTIDEGSLIISLHRALGPMHFVFIFRRRCSSDKLVVRWPRQAESSFAGSDRRNQVIYSSRGKLTGWFGVVAFKMLVKLTAFCSFWPRSP